LSAAVNAKKYLVKPGGKVHLRLCNPNDTSGFKGEKKQGEHEMESLAKKLDPLQEVLYAEHKHKVLIVLQGMDTSGKDGTIRRVFEGVNPEGVSVAHFGPPTAEEADHDYLWRAHKAMPEKGKMVIFNRSHYESVLVERVHGIVPKKVWKRRYRQINEFERMLSEEGTTIAKFYLHIDKKEQEKRFQDRLDDSSKHWKFSARDPKERMFWNEYMEAYEDVLHRTSTEWAPWYLVPSNHAWFRDLVVSSAIVKTLEGLRMRYPRLQIDKKKLMA
jgi:PPK2 family polyphosphate:nucleotide phosphotransferase